LLKSRDLYKDLMHCSADFGWETDAQGAFSYVSPSGALGFSAKDMNGRRAESLFQLSPEDARIVFSTRLPQRMTKVRACDHQGHPVLLSVSCVPVTDPEGAWCGARGVARDISRENEREIAQKLDQARQSLLARIVLDIRMEADPAEIVASAAEAAAQALRSHHGWALRHETSDDDTPMIRHSPLDKGGELVEMALSALDRSAQEGGQNGDEDARVELGHGDIPCLIAWAGPAQGISATIIFTRDASAEPWRAHEVELVHGICGHLAIALKQADMVHKLRILSRVDDLTGLLNRRALFEEMSARLGHQKRSRREGCFLFIDLDHFKQVNDRLGHAAGDAVLRKLGSLLRNKSRVGDLEGRIGGDEFGLWLQDTDLDGAEIKAKNLLELVPLLRETAGDRDSPLSMSIGIARSRPDHPDSPEHLADRADHALYAAKQQGRAAIVIAPDDVDHPQKEGAA
jgi:diguanylate cyclase (GGDEF)-like protein/PAS domain S-box-containing protein